MKKKKFTLKLCGMDNQFHEVDSTDYDEEVGLVRFKDTLYDIRTGLWVVRLQMIRNGTETWRSNGCTKVEDLKMTEMLFYVKNNLSFMNGLNKARETEGVKKLPTMNEVVKNLFTLD